MSGARDLLASERGTWCLALLAIATVFVVVSKLTGPEWAAFVASITVYLVAAKTVTGVTELRTTKEA